MRGRCRSGWDRLARAPVQFDLAARHRARRENEDKGVAARPRPAEGDRIGAENRRGPARRGDPGVAWGTGERDQPVLGKRLDLGPERGEMDAAIDRERGDAAGPRLLREQRPSPLAGARQTVGSGKSVSVRVDHGGRRFINKKTHTEQMTQTPTRKSTNT